MSAAEAKASRHAVTPQLRPQGKISLPVSPPVPSRVRDETNLIGVSRPRAVPFVVTGRTNDDRLTLSGKLWPNRDPLQEIGFQVLLGKPQIPAESKHYVGFFKKSKPVTPEERPDLYAFVENDPLEKLIRLAY